MENKYLEKIAVSFQGIMGGLERGIGTLRVAGGKNVAPQMKRLGDLNRASTKATEYSNFAKNKVPYGTGDVLSNKYAEKAMQHNAALEAHAPKLQAAQAEQQAARKSVATFGAKALGGAAVGGLALKGAGVIGGNNMNNPNYQMYQ